MLLAIKFGILVGTLQLWFLPSGMVHILLPTLYYGYYKTSVSGVATHYNEIAIIARMVCPSFTSMYKLHIVIAKDFCS